MPTGTKVVKGDPIYPRFEIPEMVEVVVEEIVEEAVDTSNIPPLKENITYDDFEKLDLRVAKVVSCEKVPKSKKLLKFVLDIGVEERTVLSGISQYYEPETMVGKKVIYLANLAPKKMMGIESYGMKLFDTHAHVNDGRFDNDRDEMLQSCFDAGVEYIMIPGVDRGTVESGLALAKQYDRLYAAVGTHPHESKDFTEEDYEFYKDQALNNDKVRAIGEIGLDYYYDFSDRETQKRVFIRQLELAREVDLPIIIHDRDAHGDIMNILRNEGKDNWGIFHCYSGSWEMAKEAIKLGFYISFAGPVVFPKSTNLKEVAKQVPVDRILIETDSPYLIPPPFRGRRNDPSKTQFVAEEIARLKDMDVDEFCEITYNNGKRVFGID